MTENLHRDVVTHAAMTYEDDGVRLEGVPFLTWARMKIGLALSDAGAKRETRDTALQRFERDHALGECGDRACGCVGLVPCWVCEEVDGPGAPCACERAAA